MKSGVMFRYTLYLENLEEDGKPNILSLPTRFCGKKREATFLLFTTYIRRILLKQLVMLRGIYNIEDSKFINFRSPKYVCNTSFDI